MNRRRVAAILLLFAFVFVPVASADPTLYECPGSHAHVWDKDQCPRLGGPFQPGTGGTGNEGLIERILKGLGGLLGL